MVPHVNSVRGDLCTVPPVGTEDTKTPTGPRGGTSTVTKTGLIRFVVYLHQDERQALRREAFEQAASASDIVRRALRAYLEIED